MVPESHENTANAELTQEIEELKTDAGKKQAAVTKEVLLEEFKDVFEGNGLMSGE